MIIVDVQKRSVDDSPYSLGPERERNGKFRNITKLSRSFQYRFRFYEATNINDEWSRGSLSSKDLRELREWTTKTKGQCSTDEEFLKYSYFRIFLVYLESDEDAAELLMKYPKYIEPIKVKK